MSLIPAEDPEPIEPRYDVVKRITTSEQDWIELMNIAAKHSSQGKALHELLKMEKVFSGTTNKDLEDLDKIAQVQGGIGMAIHEMIKIYKIHSNNYDGIAAGFFESDGEKAGLKL